MKGAEKNSDMPTVNISRPCRPFRWPISVRCIRTLAPVLTMMIFAEACSPAGGNKRGHEFMPDMVHSIAYEANIYDYYYYNTWGSEEEYKEMVNPREPVAGTVARGHISVAGQADPAARMKALRQFDGTSSHVGIAVTPNGAVPYYYDDTEEDRMRASQEIIDNPFPITTTGMARGKELFDIYCGICHGAKADGDGYLASESNPNMVYPSAPANFMLPHFIDTTNGMFYHSIMYGKNVMGSYSDKLSYEERWQVIHYIRSLQAKSAGLIYSEDENTFTNDVTGASIHDLLEIPGSANPEGAGHDEEGDGHGDTDEDHTDEEHGDEQH